jgi:transcriptional regulator with XRE-family HTH domain
MFEYDDQENSDTIGSILRQQRKSKKLDLEGIAEELKIRPQYLEALENDQFDFLPGTLYQRSFLKTYAQFLDLDPDRILKMLDQYEKSQKTFQKEPEGKKLSEESIEEDSTLPSESTLSKRRIGYYFAAFAGLALVIFCLIYLLKPDFKKKDNIVLEPSAAVKESLTAKPEVVDTPSFAWRLDNLLTDSTEMILRIKAKRSSRVKVIADAKTLFSGIIAAGMTIEFKANDYFSLNLDTNEGVEIYLNGMQINPLRKGIYRLDRKNYKSFFSQNP